MSVFHIAHDDQVVEQVLQTVLHLSVAGVAERAGILHDLMVHQVVGVAMCTHGLAINVVIEFIEHRRRCTIRTGVNVVQHGIVGRDDEAIVGVHRVQIRLEVEVLNGPVDDVHGLFVHQCGERHRRIAGGGEHLI